MSVVNSDVVGGRSSEIDFPYHKSLHCLTAVVGTTIETSIAHVWLRFEDQLGPPVNPH